MTRGLQLARSKWEEQYVFKQENGMDQGDLHPSDDWDVGTGPDAARLRSGGELTSVVRGLALRACSLES